MRIAIVVACAALICFAMPSCKKAKTGQSTYAAYDEAVQKAIKKNVDDDARKNKLLALNAKVSMQQMDTAFIFAEIGIKMRSKANLTPEEAEQLLAEAAEKRLKAFKEMSATKREMRELVSEEEWEKIFVASAKGVKQGEE